MVGSRLRRLRLDRGLTQKELAAPRYTHAYISSIESGRRRPSRDALEHLAGKLQIGVEELLTGRPPDLAARLELRLQESRVALSDGRLEDADKILRAVAREARKYDLPRLEAKAEEGRGLWLERRGETEAALEAFQRAEEILRDEPAGARADAIAGKARCFLGIGDTRYAVHVLETLLRQMEVDGLADPEALARVHASLVDAYLDAGLYERAAISAAELDRLAPRLEDAGRLAQMHMNVARLHLVEGRIEDAVRSLHRAEDAYRRLELHTELGGAYLARGYVLSREGDLAGARAELEEAVSVFEDTANDKDLARALNELARVERLEGRPERARELLERSIGLSGESDTPVAAWAKRELGLVLTELEPTSAEKHFRAAIELYERTEQVVDIAVTYRALGDLLAAQGDPTGGCEAYRTGILALEPRL